MRNVAIRIDYNGPKQAQGFIYRELEVALVVEATAVPASMMHQLCVAIHNGQEKPVTCLQHPSYCCYSHNGSAIT
jgi:hypothetical protein